MTKQEMIDRVARDAKITKIKAAKAIESIVSLITRGLKRGESTPLVGFGTFSVERRKARKGRNFQTGKSLKITARRVVRFACSKALKEKIR